MEGVVSTGGEGEMRAGVYVEVGVREGVDQGCGNVEGVVCVATRGGEGDRAL